MPRIVRFRMSPNVNHRYDVERNVGLRQPNMRLDVLLVQFFLNHIATYSGGRLITIAQSGVCDQSTADAIRLFQTTWNRRFGGSKPRVEVDGVVSPARGATFGSFARHPSMTWTSIALNALVGNEPNFGLDMYCRLHTHPDCPDPLKSFFARAPRYRPTSAPRLSATVAHRLNPVQQERTARRRRPGNERGAGLGAPRPSLAVRALRPGERATQTPLCPYDPNDIGVLWAQGVLSEGRRLFTPYEYSELLETMQSTGDWSHEQRKELLLQLIYTYTGESYPPDITVTELRELMRQEASLGPTIRPSGHPYHF